MAVRGLDLFAKAMEAHKEMYVLIGGCACHLNLEAAGIDFRATKDLDIVLSVETKTLDAGFAGDLWAFIKKGQYGIREKSSGRPIFYRFAKPVNNAYPYMLELFSRRLDRIALPEDAGLTPIPVDSELSSLSAILLNEDYFRLVMDHRKMINSIPCVSAECLIPMKARAYLDLEEGKKKGVKIDSDNITKHKKDVFRMAQLLTEDTRVEVSKSIREDLKAFLEAIVPFELKSLGMKDAGWDETNKLIQTAYGVNDEQAAGHGRTNYNEAGA